MVYVIIAVFALAFLCTVVRSVRKANQALAIILNQEGARGMTLNSRMAEALRKAGELGGDIRLKAERLAAPCRVEIYAAANVLVNPRLGLHDKYELVSRHHDQAAWRLETLEWHVQQALLRRGQERPEPLREPEPPAVTEPEPATRQEPEVLEFDGERLTIEFDHTGRKEGA
jgi:hypothetical protein